MMETSQSEVRIDESLNSSGPAHPRAEVLKALLSERFSCRSFLQKEVAREVIEKVLSMAQCTPSWCNSQPWQVTITSGAATESLATKLVKMAQSGAFRSDFEGPAEYRGVYLERRREAGYGLYQHAGIDRADKEGRQRQMLENYRFFGAPHTAIITTDKLLGTYGAVDCGGFISNFMLAAHSLGIATVPQAAVAMVSDTVREHLNIPDDRLIVCAVSFGYADTAAPINGLRTSRAGIDESVQWI